MKYVIEANDDGYILVRLGETPESTTAKVTRYVAGVFITAGVVLLGRRVLRRRRAAA